MKTIFFTLGILLAIFAAAPAQQPAADEVNAVRNRFKAEFELLERAEATAAAPAANTYTQELGKLKAAAQSKGDLKTVLEMDRLLMAVRDGSPDEPASGATPALRTAFSNYQRTKSAAMHPHVAKRQQLEADYSRAMAALELQFTRSGNIAAAKLAHDAKAVAPNADTEVVAAFTNATLRGERSVRSEKSYKPPLEIECHLESDGDTRISYACDQLIFNWANIPGELRIDGGPAANQHKKGQGTLAKNKPAIIKLTVLPRQMSVSVDGRERARWQGDFSAVDQPISIRGFRDVTVKVEQVVVRRLK